MNERSFFEHEATPEVEKPIESRVVLSFMRHGKKEKIEGLPDPEVPLTIQGLYEAWKKGAHTRAKPEVSVILGGPRKRTRETALHVMMGGKAAPHTTLEQMEAQIAQEMSFGKKTKIDRRLDFNTNGPVGREALAAAKEGRYFKYLSQQSDQRAIETGDRESTTLTRHAGFISELINRYLRVSEAFHRLATAPEQKYAKFGNRLERYLGTHQGIQESFIIKALEAFGDNEKKQAFIEAYPNGFKELQGMDIEITTSGDQRTITLSYEIPAPDGRMQKEAISLTPEILQKIIEEHQEFEKTVEEAI